MRITQHGLLTAASPSAETRSEPPLFPLSQHPLGTQQQSLKLLGARAVPEVPPGGPQRRRQREARSSLTVPPAAEVRVRAQRVPEARRRLPGVGTPGSGVRGRRRRCEQEQEPSPVPRGASLEQPQPRRGPGRCQLGVREAAADGCCFGKASPGAQPLFLPLPAGSQPSSNPFSRRDKSTTEVRRPKATAVSVPLLFHMSLPPPPTLFLEPP